MRILWIFLILIAIPAKAADRAYVTGKLAKVVTTDLSSTLTIPPTAPNTSALVLPLQLGVLYIFTVESDGITYLAGCTSKKKKSFAADWVVLDPIQFRLQKDKLYLKKPSGKELRLGLVSKRRAGDSEPTTSSANSQIPIDASARQNLPECR